MLIHKDTISQILNDPSAPSIVAQLHSALEVEKQNRQKFYAEIDDDMKAEFINGEIIIHSPVKKEHTDAVGYLYRLLSLYVDVNDLGFVGYEKVLIALSRNDYEPDLVYFNKTKSKEFKKGHWKYPAPDFIVEVTSKSTEDKDRGIKFEDYALHKIQEYWIIDPIEEFVEQYFLNKGKYKLQQKLTKGNIESKVIKNLSIDIKSIFDEKANLKEIKKILKG